MPADKATRSSRARSAKKVIDLLQQTKLIDLNQPVSSVVGLLDRLDDDIDGHAICWLHYVLIGPGPRQLDEIVQPAVKG